MALILKKNFLTKRKIFKPLVLKKKNINGLSFGKHSIGHRGGGVCNLYRFIDYKRYISFVPGYIIDIIYDPNRNRLIFFLSYTNGILCYNLASDNLYIGDFIENFNKNNQKIGNSLSLYMLPSGSFINSIELVPNLGSKYGRSSGIFLRIFGFFSK